MASLSPAAPRLNVAAGATAGKVLTGTGPDAAAWQTPVVLAGTPTGRLAAPGAYAPPGLASLVRSLVDGGERPADALSGYRYGPPAGGVWYVVNRGTPEVVNASHPGPVPGIDNSRTAQGMAANQNLVLAVPPAYAGWYFIQYEDFAGAISNYSQGSIDGSKPSYYPADLRPGPDLFRSSSAGSTYAFCAMYPPGTPASAWQYPPPVASSWRDYY